MGVFLAKDPFGFLFFWDEPESHLNLHHTVVLAKDVKELLFFDSAEEKDGGVEAYFQVDLTLVFFKLGYLVVEVVCELIEVLIKSVDAHFKIWSLNIKFDF